MTSTTAALLLPGLGGIPAGHWQACWETRAGFRRVEQSDWCRPRRGDWMARLDEVLLEVDEDIAAPPALLVAHGLGCQLVASWAAHTRHASRVAGALLVDPHDTETDALPQLAGWRPMARQSLPFASTVAAGGGCRHVTPDRARELAAAWGSGFVLFDGDRGGDAAAGRPERCDGWAAGLILLDALAAHAASSPPRASRHGLPAADAAGQRSESRRPDGATTS